MPIFPADIDALAFDLVTDLWCFFRIAPVAGGIEMEPLTFNAKPAANGAWSWRRCGVSAPAMIVAPMEYPLYPNLRDKIQILVDCAHEVDFTDQNGRKLPIYGSEDKGFYLRGDAGPKEEAILGLSREPVFISDQCLDQYTDVKFALFGVLDAMCADGYYALDAWRQFPRNFLVRKASVKEIRPLARPLPRVSRCLPTRTNG